MGVQGDHLMAGCRDHHPDPQMESGATEPHHHVALG